MTHSDGNWFWTTLASGGGSAAAGSSYHGKTRTVLLQTFPNALPESSGLPRRRFHHFCRGLGGVRGCWRWRGRSVQEGTAGRPVRH